MNSADSSVETVIPYIRIVEQPARGGTRFRYECEGRSAGSIPGVGSTNDITTYPAIQIMNYKTGRALVIVSCVTKDYPYRQHPHNLVGERCANGVCKFIIDNKDMIATFPSMGIQCAKRNDIKIRLKKRQSLQIDPFNCGFDHMHYSSFEINLSAVRLCFQVLLEDINTTQFSKQLEPVVSDVIFDKKSCNDLNIIDISTNTISSNGDKLMLFTSFVSRDDIEVRFYQIDSKNNIVWQELGVIAFIYRHIGISLLTPKYVPKSNDITSESVTVFVHLRRPSDQQISQPIQLQIVQKPNDFNGNVSKVISNAKSYHANHNHLKRKLCSSATDSWKEIAIKKPNFSFPILKAAIKRDAISSSVEKSLAGNYNKGLDNDCDDHSIEDTVIDLTTNITPKHMTHSNDTKIDFVSQTNLKPVTTTPTVTSTDFCCQVNTIDDEELNAINASFTVFHN